MPTKVIMPQLTTTMEEGAISHWFKKHGEAVRAGEPLLEVETDKANVEIEAQADGTLHTLFPEGTTVEVGTVIGWILAPGEALPEDVISGVVHRTERPEVGASLAARATAGPTVRASPAARRLARDRDINLSLVSGSGPDGRIVSEDVIAYEAEQTKAPSLVEPESEEIPLSRVRRAIAEKMSQSFRSAPHFSLSIEVDMGQVDRLKARWGETATPAQSAPLSYTAILVKATSLTLRQHPNLNASFQRESIKRYRDINIGVAVATENGLIVPVVRQADNMSLEEIAKVLQELQRKAREGKFLPQEITGGTFTISNLGMYGLAQFTAIINPPEVAILAVGGIVDSPVVRNGAVVVRPVMNLTLSIDHRAVDGVAGAEFLRDIQKWLEEVPAMSLD